MRLARWRNPSRMAAITRRRPGAVPVALTRIMMGYRRRIEEIGAILVFSSPALPFRRQMAFPHSGPVAGRASLGKLIGVNATTRPLPVQLHGLRCRPANRSSFACLPLMEGRSRSHRSSLWRCRHRRWCWRSHRGHSPADSAGTLATMTSSMPQHGPLRVVCGPCDSEPEADESWIRDSSCVVPGVRFFASLR